MAQGSQARRRHVQVFRPSPAHICGGIGVVHLAAAVGSEKVGGGVGALWPGGGERDRSRGTPVEVGRSRRARGAEIPVHAEEPGETVNERDDESRGWNGRWGHLPLTL